MLEGIVRPFQTVIITPPVRFVAATPATQPGNVLLSFGKTGAIKSVNGSFNATISIFIGTVTKEVTRDTSIKTITNPDDPTQHLDVEVINKLTSESGGGQSYKKEVLTLKNTGGDGQ